MITRTQRIAMFAILSVAAVGIATAPSAYAILNTYNLVTNVDDGTTVSSGWDSVDCIYTTDNCEHKMKVYNNNPSDKVKVYYNVENATCDVKVIWYDDSAEEVNNWTRSSYSGSGASVTYSMPITDHDDLVTVVEYTNCISQ